MISYSSQLQNRWLSVAAACGAIGAVALVPALSQGQQPSSVDMPMNVGTTDVGLGEDFSLIFHPGGPKGRVEVHPGKGYAVGSPQKPIDQRGDLKGVWTITVLQFETNSHCYTVIIGGKETEVCPQH